MFKYRYFKINLEFKFIVLIWVDIGVVLLKNGGEIMIKR